MKSMSLLKGAVASGVTFLLLAPLAAQADVKIETLTHLNEVTGIANHDSDTTDYFQGDKKREENQRKFTGAVLGAWQSFRGEDKGSVDIDIYDVSANKHWNVDPQKKTYSVESIYDPNQPSNSPPEGGTTQHQEKQQQDQDVKVTKNEFTVKDTGQTKTVNGFDSHEYLVTWDVETLNTKTGEKGRDLMTTDTWTSTDARLAKAREAEAAYDKAYRRLMKQPEPDANDAYKVYGLEDGQVQVEGQDMKAAVDKLRAIKGLPVSTDVRWELGGTDKDGKQTNDSDAGKDSGKTLDSALGGLFGHKSDDSNKQQQQPGTPGLTTMFSAHYEVKAVDTAAVDATQFQMPSDYKLDN